MKNKLIYCFLILALFCAAADAARPQKKSSADEIAPKQQQYNTNKKYGQSDFSKANRAYLSGDLEKAELILNSILLSNPDFTEALELKNKILIIKEKLFVSRRDIAEDYMIKSDRSFRDGNFYEGLLYYKRAVDMIPEIYDAQKYNTMIGELNAQSFRYKGSDRKNFLLSVESFQDGDFKKAKDLIYGLVKSYDHMKTYAGVANFYMIEQANRKRVDYYYQEALSEFKSGRFENARIALDFALAINDKLPALLLLSEQINIEL